MRSLSAFFFPLFIGFLITLSSIAAGLKCEICGMLIEENGRNHIHLEHESKPGLHVCSPTCASKARKYDAKFNKSEVRNFNKPEQVLVGEQAFFLAKSEKIKADMGKLAMAPYLAAFATKTKAEAAQKKYGDGQVVEGLENALKASK